MVRRFPFRSRRRPPSPPLFHSYLRAINEPQLALHEMLREYGDFVCWRGFFALYLVNHPDSVRHIMSPGFTDFSKDLVDYRILGRVMGQGMVCSDGPHWHEQRQQMQPFFADIGRFDDTINTDTSSFLESWETRPRDDTVWLDKEMSWLMLRLMGSIVLGRDVRQHFTRIDEMVAVLNKNTRDVRSLLTLQSWIPTPHNWRWRRARKTLDTIAYESIAAHRRQPSQGPDILSYVLRMCESGDSEKTDRQIRDEAVTFMISNFGPTTSALAWTLYLLAANPRYQTALAEHLTARLKGAPATAGDLPKLPLLKRIVQESVRLYPPVAFYARRAEHENELAEGVLPAKAAVAVIPYALHRHPDFWPDPERFDPDRFLPGEVKKRHFFSYLPFGAGPRVCIGAGLAMRQVQLVLAQIVQRFAIFPLPDHPVVPSGGVTLMPRYGIPVTLAAR